MCLITLRLAIGCSAFNGEPTEIQLISNKKNPAPTYEQDCTEMGVGTTVLRKMKMKIIPGKTCGRIVVTIEDVQ